MEISIPGSARYTMSHGELLPSYMADDTLQLKTVVSTLYGKSPVGVLVQLRYAPIFIPEGAQVTLSYLKLNGQNSSISDKNLLSLSETEILDIKIAMESANKTSRPIISYACTDDKSGLPVRLKVAYNHRSWECVLATNVSYMEVNLVYQILCSQGLCD